MLIVNFLGPECMSFTVESHNIMTVTMTFCSDVQFDVCGLFRITSCKSFICALMHVCVCGAVFVCTCVGVLCV